MVRLPTNRILVRIPATKIVEFTRDVGASNFMAMPPLNGVQLCVVQPAVGIETLRKIPYALSVERGNGV